MSVGTFLTDDHVHFHVSYCEDDMGRAVRVVALSALSKDTNGAPHVASF
jgi:hypothetical protein